MSFKVGSQRSIRNLRMNVLGIPVASTTAPAIVTGELWLWGNNGYGELSDYTTISKSSPVQTVSGGTNWKSLTSSLSLARTTSIIKTDGTLWLWGQAGQGTLGDGSGISKSSPVQTISNGTNWSSVSTGYQFVGAIKTDGTLWTWGTNNRGQLGNGTGGSGTQKASPVQTIAGGTNWSKIAAGRLNMAAIKTDGTLWTWGEGNFGMLGDGGSNALSSPVQTISGGTNWSQVSAGGYNIAAIKTDGTLWTWGYNVDGRLGDNTTIYRNSPIQTVASGTNWSQVSAGYGHLAAIKTDGTLWTWGRNNYGQLGDNTRIHRSSPVQTLSGGTNWSRASAGGYHTAAIKTDGTLWLWGYNSGGMLGDNTNINRSSPVQTVSGGTNWKWVFAARYHTVAIK